MNKKMTRKQRRFIWAILFLMFILFTTILIAVITVNAKVVFQGILVDWEANNSGLLLRFENVTIGSGTTYLYLGPIKLDSLHNNTETAIIEDYDLFGIRIGVVIAQYY